MKLLDLCDDVFGLVIDQVYRNRAVQNRKHFEYIVKHGCRVMMKRQWQRNPKWTHKHTQRFWLVRHVQAVYFKGSLISWRYSRDYLRKCFEDNMILGKLKKNYNRKKMCEVLLALGVSQCDVHIRDNTFLFSSYNDIQY